MGIKSLFLAINSQLDVVANNLTNHEALASANIKSMEQSLAKARFECAKLSQDKSRKLTQYQESLAKMEIWKNRTRETHKKDPEAAKLCVEQVQFHKEEAERFHKQYLVTQQMEQQLATKIEASKEGITRLKQRRTNLIVKEQCHKIDDKIHGTLKNDSVEEILDDWEAYIGIEPSLLDGNPEINALEERFKSEEKEQAISELLKEIIAE